MTTPNIKRIGKYEVIDVLGRGGMGLVYRAFDRQLNREVAIKTVTEGFTGDQEMLQRFYREAAKTGALKHPNIVIVYDLGEQDGFPYIVMEYLSGDPLDKIIQMGKPQPLPFKLHIIEQVCYALGYAHRNDVIHRDVKPANVIVQPDGIAKLLDFGIARQEKTDGHLTRTGHVIGTLQYMAPERLKNAPFDGRSDIFSVGVMMFQLLTGQLPFGGDYSIVQKILTEKHAPLSQFVEKYPQSLDDILDRAMAKDPDDRYSSADEMANELATVVQDLKREQVTEWIQRAEQLVKEEQYTTARDVLLRLLKVDSQHTGARQLIAQVQQNLNMRQKAEQIRQFRGLADQAVAEKHFDEAIDYLQQARGLDPSNAELGELLESVREKKRRKALVDGYLHEADIAREHGDLSQAEAVIAKAIEVDRTDSRVRAAHVALARLIEETTRQAKTKRFLENARQEINARHFTAAIEALAEVEQIDPANPELISLQATAKAGRDQEQRRRILEQLQNDVALASTTDELNRAAQQVSQALERMPAEPSLIKLKGIVASRLRDDETRRRIDDITARCRSVLETSPEDALKLVREALREAPGNERLHALQNAIVARISDRKQEQVRAEYLTRAHEALTAGRYTDALRLLEACQRDGISSPEITELIEFARQEAARQAKNAQIQKVLKQAQDLMSQRSYAAVVELLSPLQADQGASSLKFLLDDARNRLQTLQSEITCSLQFATALESHEQYSEAVKFLEAQSADVSESESVRSALSRLRQASENEFATLRAIGTAYAALDRLETGGGTLPETREGSSPLLARIVPAFSSRRKSIADGQLSSAIKQARSAIDAGDKKDASKHLKEVVAFLPFASGKLQEEWHALQKKAEKGKIFGKLGQK